MSVLNSHKFANRFPGSRAAWRRGFTAIEMVSVATIMVILSLVLVINVRKRVDESRIAAAKEEMNELAKVESLVYGENGHYFILQDLDNIPALGVSADIGVPQSFYTSTTLTVFGTADSRYRMLQETWHGPYTQFKRYITVDNIVDASTTVLSRGLVTLRPELFYQPSSGHFGPLWPLYNAEDKYPLDPWGNPYIFEVLATGQARIYSLGPDGLPGLVGPAQTSDANYVNGLYFYTYDLLYHPDGQLGVPGKTGDDLELTF